MPTRYTLLALALLLFPSVGYAQLAETQVEPNLQILAPADIEVNFNNFTFDYPEPYPDPDTTVTGSIGASLFETTNSGGDPIPLGVTYEEAGVVIGDLSLTFTAAGGIDACDVITNDLTGLIAFIERGTCNFNNKAKNAENAGAVGVVIFNQERPDDTAINMSAGDTTIFVGIPAVQLPRFLAGPIIASIDDGNTVSAAICAYEEDPDGVFLPCVGSIAAEPSPDPAAFGLAAAVPNPFTSSTSLKLALRDAQEVRVEVFNALGQRVAVLHDGLMAGGVEHRLTLDGTRLPSGVYLVRATGEGISAAQQVSLVK